jgi:hypothetical protein
MSVVTQPKRQYLLFYVQAFFKIYRVRVSFLFLFSPLAVHLLLGSNKTYVRFLKTKLFCVQYTKVLFFFK